MSPPATIVGTRSLPPFKALACSRCATLAVPRPQQARHERARAAKHARVVIAIFTIAAGFTVVALLQRPIDSFVVRAPSLQREVRAGGLPRPLCFILGTHSRGSLAQHVAIFTLART